MNIKRFASTSLLAIGITVASVSTAHADTFAPAPAPVGEFVADYYQGLHECNAAVGALIGGVIGGVVFGSVGAGIGAGIGYGVGWGQPNPPAPPLDCWHPPGPPPAP